ncbi:cephalosporin hydroxylase family protein [Alsobacter sp. SYSU M60028]|uniref:Cephalosporin hydroxylase family protein n=1 Tax=Alsobacter ponti TaxID=2962936 RepID=A0ABT1LG87_9HYPH|nr:CmcI family methyltransferase [Alsobacter ponti]MCP8940108.1 cephalosporin hydroxylase family protein [Alsobacter ponti]
MRVNIDTERRVLELGDRTLELYSDEAFHVLSDLWVKVGWNQKYSYSFAWLGVPVIQMPEDMIRYQEAVAALRPDVIVETGVAHGGSAIYSASLCRLLGKGRVIAIDIEIRPANRARIESHPLSDLITLIEGSSTAPEVLDKVRSLIAPGETVMVVLDSDHSYKHVAEELELYAPLVTPGSWIVATDGVMKDLADTPRGRKEWTSDNPTQAARDFAARHPEFSHEQPPRVFNEGTFQGDISHWPEAWLKRIR